MPYVTNPIVRVRVKGTFDSKALPPDETLEVLLDENFSIERVGDLVVPHSRRAIGVADDYTATDDDYYIGVTNTSAPRFIIIPSAVDGYDGKQFIVKDESNNASVNSIFIVPAIGEIDFEGSGYTINTDLGSVTVERRDGRYWIIAKIV